MAKARRFFITLFVLLLLAAAAAPGVYFYKKYADSQKQIQTQNQPQPAKDAETQKKEMIERVATHMVLPEGETPEVLTITEREKLVGQEFFTKAKNGDILLVYYAAKKAILYDPILDKILEIGPVTVNNTPTPSERVQNVNTTPTLASPSAQPSPTGL